MKNIYFLQRFSETWVLTKKQNLEELVEPLKMVLGESFGAEVGNFNLKNNR